MEHQSPLRDGEERRDCAVPEDARAAQRDGEPGVELLHLAGLVSEDERAGSEDSRQPRKRRAPRDSARPELKDEGIQTRNNKKRKKNRNRSGKRKMVVRPNYFVGIQVSNPEVHRAVRGLQEKIVAAQPELRSTVIPTATLHVTLAVAHLPDPAHVARAAEVMKESLSVNRDLYNNPPVCLMFSGVKTFKNQVLFADIEGGESLLRIAGLAQALEESFEESGLVLPSRKSFQPHLTILKLSKDFGLKRKGILKITPSLYSDDRSMHFGQQVVRSVQLLSMNKPKDANGYYYCSHQEIFDVAGEESGDHSGCCEKPSLGKQPPPGVGGRRHLHSLAAVEGERRPATRAEDVVRMLLLVGAVSIGVAFLLRSFSAAK
ncbi:A-kinase anchor protein 7-like [Bacillus rossius redtenbacheri]|uniref:A-kinase anchor protein 7-like n=1 Tax=Bacillus rossius redtenbacheri TaxID=93214 RepID=UPI002FDD7E84